MRSLKIFFALLILGLFGSAAPSLAQAPPPAGDKWEKADLRPMMGKGESFESTTMITVAYSFIWVMVLGFVASVWMRGARVQRELDQLNEAVARGAKKSGPPSEKA